MKIRRSEPFKRDFAKLPEEIKRRAEKALPFACSLKIPATPPSRPGLSMRKRRIWKAKVDGGYRFTFQVEGELIILRRIGPHNLMARPERR